MPTGLVWLILLLPVASFAVIALLVRPFVKTGSKIAGYIAITAIGGALALSLWTLFTVMGEPEHVLHIPEISWLTVGAMHFSVGVLMDSLTAVMLVVVTTVSLMVQIYSQGYMHGDPGYHRYYAWMSLFTASMLGLVLADNLLLMFVFWELVGLCSYLLIGFWFHRPSAANAAKKAFIVTRLGDFGFLAAILLLYSQHRDIRHRRTPRDGDCRDPCRHRSDLGGHRHLLRRRRQVGPVPAARLAARRHGRPHPGQRPDPCRHHGRRRRLPGGPHLPPVRALGAGAHRGRRHRRLHRHLRRLHGPGHDRHQAGGGLFHHQPARLHDAGPGRGRPGAETGGVPSLEIAKAATAIGIFHLFNHAFFKALLFLGSGSVNHATGTFDMRLMGGLRKAMPWTFGTFLIGGLSLAGIWPLSGFWSKDEILVTALHAPAGPLRPGDDHRIHDRLLHIPGYLPDLRRRVPRGQLPMNTAMRTPTPTSPLR